MAKKARISKDMTVFLSALAHPDQDALHYRLREDNRGSTRSPKARSPRRSSRGRGR